MFYIYLQYEYAWLVSLPEEVCLTVSASHYPQAKDPVSSFQLNNLGDRERERG